MPEKRPYQNPDFPTKAFTPKISISRPFRRSAFGNPRSDTPFRKILGIWWVFCRGTLQTKTRGKVTLANYGTEFEVASIKLGRIISVNTTNKPRNFGFGFLSICFFQLEFP